MAMALSEQAYLAGLFDGEGCISSANHNSATSHNIHPTVTISISQRTLFSKVLYDLHNKSGLGRVSDRKNGMTTWVITGKDSVRTFIKLIYPYSQIKRKQLQVGYLLAGLAGRSHTRNGNTSIPIPVRVERRLALHQELSALKGKVKL